VPNTLGEAGILINNSRPDYVAELVDVAAHDTALRQRLIESGRRQLRSFKEFKREEFLLQQLKKLGRAG
jgi:hypothetical protein